MKKNDKNYSVIILTYAPKDDLLISLEKLISQSIVPKKIILYNTDRRSFYSNIKDKDKFDKLLSSNSDLIKIVNIEKNEFDHGKTRNDAMELVNTDYALFLTDDAIAYDESLSEHLIDSFEKYSDNDGKVAAVYARQIAKDDAKISERYVREFNYPDYDIVKTKKSEAELEIKNYFFSNVCAMYDRSVFYTLGGFEESIILNEDTFFAYNAINSGYKIVYDSKAMVYHSHNYSNNQQFSRNFDIGVSQSEKREIFDSIPTSKEGMKFVKNISFRLIKGFHLVELISFIVQCTYRYMGFKKGYKYEKLSVDDCIKYASNKNYFIKRKYG